MITDDKNCSVCRSNGIFIPISMVYINRFISFQKVVCMCIKYDVPSTMYTTKDSLVEVSEGLRIHPTHYISSFTLEARTILGKATQHRRVDSLQYLVT